MVNTMYSRQAARLQTLLKLAQDNNIDPLGLGIDLTPVPTTSESPPPPPPVPATPPPSPPVVAVPMVDLAVVPEIPIAPPLPPAVPIGVQPVSPPPPQTIVIYQPGIRDRDITIPYLLWAFDNRTNGGSLAVINPITKKEGYPRSWYRDEKVFDTIPDPETRKKARDYNANIRKEVEKMFTAWKTSYFGSIQAKNNTIETVSANGITPATEVTKIAEYAKGLKGKGNKRSKKLGFRVKVLNTIYNQVVANSQPPESEMILNFLNYIHYAELDNGKYSKILRLEDIIGICLNRMSTDGVSTQLRTIYKSMVFGMIKKWNRSNELISSMTSLEKQVEPFNMDDPVRPQQFDASAITILEGKTKAITSQLRKAYQEGRIVAGPETKIYFYYMTKAIPRSLKGMEKSIEEGNSFAASQHFSDILTALSIVTFYGIFSVVQK